MAIDVLELHGAVDCDPDADYRVPMVVIEGRVSPWMELGPAVGLLYGNGSDCYGSRR